MLLPYRADASIDWPSFEQHVARTAGAGLDVALNMDTGFGDLLTPGERLDVLDAARGVLGTGPAIYAAVFAGEGDPLEGYRSELSAVTSRGCIPVIVQCSAMRALGAEAKVALYRAALEGVERALAFELSPAFAPHGEIWDDDTFARLLDIPSLVGAKHSSLDRATELRRLETRAALRPEWRVYTGNDLAIDMVLDGSDYLLGLSTFAPQVFAERDRALANDDVEFLSINGALQHLGNVAFRSPVPAYKHSAAQFLHMTGALAGDSIHPRATRRPDSDRVLLADCAARLGLPAVTPPAS
ncbi:MAG: dihydrodipicolinate synthase family protein [Acidimicrobiia bacterium]|nr:dihydrodipicolinate synthase family protein [Acidimicrobiia bacterium]